jgi:peptidoglycan/LPS O-acetylase OafA/YrhL
MKRKIYFAGLDGLRFIAISFVVLHHFFSFRNYYDTKIIEFPVIGLIGYYGIQFFFAGSGFLITYLLLAEKQRYGIISLKKFYLRRMLRIWPAYYFLIILSLLILLFMPFFNIPHVTNDYLSADYRKANILYFLFLPHVAGISFPTAPYIHQTYTIGMEEQFYFLWGMLFIFIYKRVRTLFWIFLLFIPLLNGLNQSFLLDSAFNHNFFGHVYISFTYFLYYFRFPTFALGALWAFAYFNGRKWTKIFESKWIQIACYTGIVISIFYDVSIPYYRDEYFAFLTLCILSCAMSHKKSIINFELKWLKYLGKISYGIYLYHIIAIVLSIKLALLLFPNLSSIRAIVFLLFTVMGISIFLGWISYITLESFFLNIKKKIERV